MKVGHIVVLVWFAACAFLYNHSGAFAQIVYLAVSALPTAFFSYKLIKDEHRTLLGMYALTVFWFAQTLSFATDFAEHDENYFFFKFLALSVVFVLAVWQSSFWPFRVQPVSEWTPLIKKLGFIFVWLSICSLLYNYTGREAQIIFDVMFGLPTAFFNVVLIMDEGKTMKGMIWNMVFWTARIMFNTLDLSVLNEVSPRVEPPYYLYQFAVLSPIFVLALKGSSYWPLRV